MSDDGVHYRWRDCTMAEAIRWASTRTIRRASADRVVFTDGSAIDVESSVGDGSDFMPAALEAPTWQIGEPDP